MSLLQLDYDSLRRETGMYLGYDRDPANHKPLQILDMADVLGKAMRSWYFPVLDGIVYKWSFLQSTGSIVTIASQAEYDLPDEFASMTNECLYFAADSEKTRVTRRSEGMILSLLASSWVEGSPLYYAVRTKGAMAAGRPLHELLLYPIPSASDVSITFRYSRIPPALSESDPYPLGGELHAETILAACLAAAEQKIEDVAGLHTANFQRLLAGSIALDRENA
jgi:hypothetical protein